VEELTDEPRAWCAGLNKVISRNAKKLNEKSNHRLCLALDSAGKNIAASAINCVSNLKHVGTAITMFAADNNDGLPGPRETGTACWYFNTPLPGGAKYNCELPYYLATYLGGKDPARMTATETNYIQVLVCPGYEQILAGESHFGHDAHHLRAGDSLQQRRGQADREGVKIHAFDDWPDSKFNFMKQMLTDQAARDSIAISVNGIAPKPASAAPGQKPIYRSAFR